MTEKIAIPLEGMKSVVLLNNGERMTREKAIKAGYRLVDSSTAAKAAAEPSENTAFMAWRTQVSCLPEARDRPSAVAELLSTQTHATMSLEQARGFLRGLPTEATEEDLSVQTDNTSDPRAARLAEISESVRLFNKDRGFASKSKPAPSIASIDPTRLRRLAEIRLAALDVNGANRTERLNLAYALQVHDQTGSPLTSVFAQLGVDTSKIIPST